MGEKLRCEIVALHRRILRMTYQPKGVDKMADFETPALSVSLSVLLGIVCSW